MPAGITDVASLDGNWVQTVYEDALAVARAQNVMAGLVTTFTDRADIAARVNPEWDTTTTQTVAEADDYAAPSQLGKTALATLTPSEAIGQVNITDRRVRTDPDGVRNQAASELGSSFADKVETDLLSTFSGLTAGTIGAAGTVATWGHVFAAKAVLKGNKVPEPYRLVIHEYQWFQLAKSASVAGVGARSNAADSTLEGIDSSYYVSSIAGVDIFVTPNIAIDANADARGALFNQQALALDWRQAPRLEPERDASARKTELNLVGDYAYGVWRPKFGVQILLDATTPTS